MIPSEPPWNGTENFKNSFVGPLVPVVSRDALNDLPACSILALGCTIKLPTLKSPETLLTGDLGTGPIQLTLSVVSEKSHPKKVLILKLPLLSICWLLNEALGKML